MVEGVRGLSGASLIRGLIPFMGTPHLDLITSRRSHLLIPSPWGLGRQHLNLGREEHKTSGLTVLSSPLRETGGRSEGQGRGPPSSKVADSSAAPWAHQCWKGWVFRTRIETLARQAGWGPAPSACCPPAPTPSPGPPRAVPTWLSGSISQLFFFFFNFY